MYFLNRYTFFLFFFFVQGIFSNWFYASSILLLMILPQVMLVFWMLFKPLNPKKISSAMILTLVTFFGCTSVLIRIFELTPDAPSWGLWLYVIAQLIMIWESMSSWSRINTNQKPFMTHLVNIVVPFLFGASLIYLWEILTVGYNVPQILLP